MIKKRDYPDFALMKDTLFESIHKGFTEIKEDDKDIGVMADWIEGKPDIRDDLLHLQFAEYKFQLEFSIITSGENPVAIIKTYERIYKLARLIPIGGYGDGKEKLYLIRELDITISHKKWMAMPSENISDAMENFHKTLFKPYCLSLIKYIDSIVYE